MKHHLVFPMFLYVLYMAGLSVFMFRSRVRAVKAGHVSPRYFKAFANETPPERLILIGRHYDNQFQLPILFFITCLVYLILDGVNELTLVMAWLFVGSRFFHAWVHLGRNRIYPRVGAFALGWSLIVLMWVQIVCSVFILANQSPADAALKRLGL